MKLSTKIILPIILISALLILLAGCFGVPADESPETTTTGGGTITGIIAAPCCYTSGEPVSENSGSPEYWCYYCENDWYLQEGIEVILTSGQEVIATTTTEQNGKYTFTGVPPGENFVITAYCPDKEMPLVMDVVPKLTKNDSFDAGTTDLVSTSLGLVVDYVTYFAAWDPEDISLKKVIAAKPDFTGFPKFKKLIEEVRRVLESCEDVDTDVDVLEALCLAAEEISKSDMGCAPGYTPEAEVAEEPGPGPGPTPPVTYVLTMAVYPTGSGTVNGAGSYAAGVTANITAAPIGDYQFVNWTGDTVADPNSASTSILMNGNKSVTAHFIFEEGDPCIINPPTANANGPYYDDAICGSSVTITLDGSASTAGGTPIVSWEWSETTLGPLGTGETLDYDFDPDSYTVTLEVTDENGCTDSDTASVLITAVGGPTANANGPYYDDAICGSSVTITLDGSASTAGGTPIVSWEWSETTLGPLGTGETLDYDFDPDSYTVTLEVTDENGCTDSDTASVLITAVGGPTANANGPYYDDAICGSSVTITLDGSASTAGGTPIVSWEWSETTLGPLGTGETLDYDFDPGSYTVTLEVTDENGCTDSDTASVLITAVGGPTANANGPYYDDAICGSSVTITLDGSASTAGGTPIVSWEWSETTLGPLGTGETLDYDFDPGSYTVTLEVTDENGCTDSDTASVLITAVGGPTANANGPYYDDAICGSSVTITLDGSASTAGGTPIVSWEWSETTLGPLGTGETLDYDFDPGSYTVTLEVTDENDCTDTDTASVLITDVCNDLNYLLIHGYNSASGCVGGPNNLIHEETPVVPRLINTGLWLTSQNHTPNVKHINFVARYSGASTKIEYRYRYQIQWLANSTPEPFEAWSPWSNSGTSLGEDIYGYGFVSDCMYAPSKTSTPKYYCYQFEIEIAVNENYAEVDTYLVNID